MMKVAVLSMLLIATVAQVSAEIGAGVSPLYTYGPMGIILSWFMYMASKFTATLKADNAELRTELRGLGGKIESMARAMLVDVMSRDSTGIHSKQQARELLDELKTK